MRAYSPGGELNALAAAPEGSNPPTPSSHRLQRGLPGYLILFAPHAFAPQRQCQARKPPSPPVFLPISAHSTATPGIPLSSPALKNSSIEGSLQVKLVHFTSDWLFRLHALTPSKSGQRLLPPYYRGCWHGVSRSFLQRYRRSRRNGHSSLWTVLYTPKGFIAHAASLRQAFAHCAIFLTAASRRSLGRISVPVWLIILSDQLPIVALVSRYLTNKLIGRRPIPECPKALIPITCVIGITCGIVPSFPGLFPTQG